MKNIRNFCIIAHVDHGKSTLADRFLELTGTIEKRKMHEQFLDMHPLERERGITIKMTPVRMEYHPQAQNEKLKTKNDSLKLKINHAERDTKILPFSLYVLNLIDTPGHVDFTYEVSRALAAVEGAVLLVDATQGVQAQTIANLHLAQKAGLKIIPAVNKIDLPSAEVEKTKEEIRNLLNDSEIFVSEVSAKTGAGVEELLQRVIAEVPEPGRDMSKFRNIDISKYQNIEISAVPLRALVFDSIYDPYQGVVAYVRIFEGRLGAGEKVRLMATAAKGEAKEVGFFSPERKAAKTLEEGEIGYVATGVKEPDRVKVGDTVTHNIEISKYQNIIPLAGYKEPEPMVFASVFPENQDDYEELREALKKLKLNDASLNFEPEQNTVALGRGFRIGFLGMLHMDIVAERLSREYGLKLVFSNPSVALKIFMKIHGQARDTPASMLKSAGLPVERNPAPKTIYPGGGPWSSGAGIKGVSEIIYSPAKIPEGQKIDKIEEPWARLEIITPASYLGVLNTLLAEHYGNITETKDLAGERLLITGEAPLREIIVDFYDQLKSVSQGFASVAYELTSWREGDLTRLDVLVAGEKIPAFTEVVPKEKAYTLGRKKLEKLKELLPRELFAIVLQVEAEGRIIARETIPAMRKDVTGYLYGGDRTRKMKLWKKQQRGKKRLLSSAQVEIPPEVFLKMIKK